MRAVIYSRFSSDKQSDNSIEDQSRNCARYAERQNMAVIKNFEDKAISGTSKNRPGFDAMLADADSGGFDVLLVDDLSRLSRDDVEMKQVIRRFKFRGIRVVGVSDGYDSDTKGEKIQATMRGLMNEIYLDDLREKTHRGLFGKAMNGYSAGGRSYGYTRVPIENPAKLDVNGRPEIVAVRRGINLYEAEYVRLIFEWFSQGQSPKTIAARLNRLGVPSPRGSTWAASAIYGDFNEGTGLLNNKLYIGQYFWNRSAWVKDPDTGKRRRTKRDAKEWVITEQPELRLVSDELWDSVQERQREIRHKSAALRETLNNPRTRSRTGKYLFSGLLQCGCCGASYTIYSSTSYGCAININRGESACANNLRLSRRILENVLLGAITDDLLSEEATTLFIEETTKLLHFQNNEQRSDQGQHRQALVKAEKQRDNIMTAIKAGILTTTTKAELEQAEAECHRAESALLSAERAEEIFTTVLPNAAERYKSLIQDLGRTLQADIPQARECLKTLLGTIRLVPSPNGRYLEAEMQQSPEGLLKLAETSGIAFKVPLVAGAGFEPTTFRL